MEVAILGAGIAGLASAISLSKIGGTVRVYERRRSVHHLGAGIVCWPNATFVLSELGILEDLRVNAGSITSMRRLTPEGVTLGTLNVQHLDAAMGFPSLSVLREDLMRALLQHAEEHNVRITYNARATAIEREANACRVRFAGGDSISPTIVVGADGRMGSIAREYVTGDNQPVYQGFVNWIGVHRWDTPVFDRLEIHDYWGVGARFGIVPVSPNTAYWAGGLATPTPLPTSSDNHIDRLKRAFDGWPSLVGDITSIASESNTKCLPLYDHDPSPCWHRDNVLMLGDAAHAALPTSGQGAAQALEDARALALAISASALDLQEAMTSFTHQRLPKTTAIIKSGRALASDLFHANAEACALRDRKAAQADYAALASAMAAGWGTGLPIGG